MSSSKFGSGRTVPKFGNTHQVPSIEVGAAPHDVSWRANGARKTIKIDSASATTYTANFGDVVVVDTTSAGVTVTLPAPSATTPDEAPISVKRLAGSNTLTIAFSGKIDEGTTNAGTTATTGKTFHGNGTNFYSMP